MTEVISGESESVADSSHVHIWYRYVVDSKEYQDYISVSLDFFNDNKIDTVVIKYNKMFPSLNTVNGLPIQERKQKGNMMYGVLFILIGIIFWKNYDRYNEWKFKRNMKEKRY